MKKFKQFLTEEYVDTIKVQYFGGITLQDIFKNPTKKEISEIIAYGIVRAIVDDENVYCFNDKVLHSKVIKYFNLKNVIPIEINFMPERHLIINVTSTVHSASSYSQIECETKIRENIYLKTLGTVVAVLFDEENI